MKRAISSVTRVHFFLSLMTIFFLSCGANPDGKEGGNAKEGPETENVDPTEHNDPADQKEEFAPPADANSLLGYFKVIDNREPFVNCGFEIENKGVAIPVELAQKYKLYHFEIYDKYESKFNADSPEININGVYRWSHLGKEILMYLVKLSIGDGSIGGAEARILVWNQDEEIEQNLFFAGTAYDDGESTICRKMTFAKDGLELNQEDGTENRPSNFTFSEKELVDLTD